MSFANNNDAAAAAAAAAIAGNDNEITYTDDEKRAIDDLKKLYMETIKIDVEMQRHIFKLEQIFESRFTEIFDQRKKILQACKEMNHGDAFSNLSKFWLNVLKSSFRGCINENDEIILNHLIDMRSNLCTDPQLVFRIEFHFEPNDFFNDKVLVKKYLLNNLPDPEDPLAYDGSEIYRCEGCEIHWKNQILRQSLFDEPSFFDFFSPPELPVDPAHENYCDINAKLQKDFEMGFYLKERVIPKAIMFFTGEIKDLANPESDNESTEDSESDVEM